MQCCTHKGRVHLAARMQCACLAAWRVHWSQVSDVPKVWAQKMESYLGVVPPDDAQGCLQDVHWCVCSCFFMTQSVHMTAVHANLSC